HGDIRRRRLRIQHVTLDEFDALARAGLERIPVTLPSPLEYALVQIHAIRVIQAVTLRPFTGSPAAAAEVLPQHTCLAAASLPVDFRDKLHLHVGVLYGRL